MTTTGNIKISLYFFISNNILAKDKKKNRKDEEIEEYLEEDFDEFGVSKDSSSKD